MKRIYLDHAAATPVHPKAVKAMSPFFTERFGNASTLYSYGHEAKEAMENARGKIADFIGAKSSQVRQFLSPLCRPLTRQEQLSL